MRNAKPIHWIAVASVMVPAYGALILCAWWLWFQPAPMRLVGFGPFVSYPVTTAEEAAQAEITEAHAGSTIYAFEQWCLDKATPGEVDVTWLNGFVQRATPKRTIGKEGCHAKSFPVRVPHVDHVTEYRMVKSITYRSNPLREHVVRYPELSLRVSP